MNWLDLVGTIAQIVIVVMLIVILVLTYNWKDNVTTILQQHRDRIERLERRERP